MFDLFNVHYVFSEGTTLNSTKKRYRCQVYILQREKNQKGTNDGYDFFCKIQIFCPLGVLKVFYASFSSRFILTESMNNLKGIDLKMFFE
jgi:hypothetical protein